MDKPDFISQSDNHKSINDRDHWTRAEQLDMIQAGATWTRISTHPTIKGLTLVEGWKSKPTDPGQDRMFSVTTKQ